VLSENTIPFAGATAATDSSWPRREQVPGLISHAEQWSRHISRASVRRLVATSRMSRESFGDMRKGMLRTRNAMCFLAVAQCLYGQLPDHDPAMGLETALERVSENFGVRVGLEYRVSAATTRAVRFG
jgi:hypothetical protein